MRSREDGSVLMLSNNHVLANENKGKRGDPILQPGNIDGGADMDKVGELLRFVRAQTGKGEPRRLRRWRRSTWTSRSSLGR